MGSGPPRDPGEASIPAGTSNRGREREEAVVLSAFARAARA